MSLYLYNSPLKTWSGGEQKKSGHQEQMKPGLDCLMVMSDDFIKHEA